MIASRSFSLIAPQRAICASVRPQPRHRPLASSILQILVQGEEMRVIPAFYPQKAANQIAAASPSRNPISAACCAAPATSPVCPLICAAARRTTP